MKKYIILSILICVMMTLINYGCEKSTDQTTSVNVAHNGQLTSRDTDPCDACALLDDCCCGIERQSLMTTVHLRICGYDDGTTSCTATPPSPCSAISGGGTAVVLDSGTPKFPFCMIPGNYFQITNTDLLNSASIKITCHYDVTNPTFTNVTIPAGGTYVWSATGGCDLSQCYP